jgi:hypothetical protein
VHQLASTWFQQHGSTWPDWPLPRLLDTKFRLDRRVNLVIPAHDEAGTISSEFHPRGWVRPQPVLRLLPLVERPPAASVLGARYGS